jgi:phosphoribosylformylglycinamidine synthase
VLASLPADRVPLAKARALHQLVYELIAAGRVRAAHDVSDGGLAVAIAEMCIASGLGASVSISRDSYPDSIFSPLATTYVLEMPETAASESGQEVIGRVEKEPRLCIAGGDVERIDVAVADLARAWRSPLAHGGGR